MLQTSGKVTIPMEEWDNLTSNERFEQAKLDLCFMMREYINDGWVYRWDLACQREKDLATREATQG